MNRGDLRARVKSEHGFDLSDATVNEVIDEKYRELCADAEWNKATVNLGTTVAGQGQYDLPANVVSLKSVTVGSVKYDRVSTDQYVSFVTGRLRVASGQGVYAPEYSAAGVSQLAVFPTPGTAGQAILAVAVLSVDALADDDAEPVIPADLHPVIAAGAIAYCLAVDDERLGDSQWWEARWEAGKEKLRRRANSRVGTGPVDLLVLPRY